MHCVAICCCHTALAFISVSAITPAIMPVLPILLHAPSQGCSCGVNRNAGQDGKPAFEHIKLVHSMAGAAVMIYLTDCLVKGQAHGISQIIAAGPAGFQRPKGQSSLLPYILSAACM